MHIPYLFLAYGVNYRINKLSAMYASFHVHEEETIAFLSRFQINH